MILLLLSLLAAAPSPEAGQAGDAAPRATIAFSKVVSRLGPDDATWTMGHGVLCLPAFGLGRASDGGHARSGRAKIADSGYEDAFRRAVQAQGVDVEGDPDNLFERKPAEVARFVVAGAITSVKAKLCQGGLDTTTIKGAAAVTVEWQIYDRVTHDVRTKITTPGAFSTDRFGHDNERIILYNAVGDSAAALVRSDLFRAQLAAPPAK